MDVKEAIAARYSCRAYKPEDVDDALIRDCLECALLAPSACNKQPWKFYVVKGEKKAKIAKCTQLFGANGFTDGAPALIVVTAKPSAIDKAADKIKNLDFSANDLGLAVGHLCLRATELGLGTCIIGWLQAKKIAKELPLSVGEKVKLIVAIGHPADEARPKKRRSADEKIVFGE